MQDTIVAQELECRFRINIYLSALNRRFDSDKNSNTTQP